MGGADECQILHTGMDMYFAGEDPKGHKLVLAVGPARVGSDTLHPHPEWPVPRGAGPRVWWLRCSSGQRESSCPRRGLFAQFAVDAAGRQGQAIED